LTVGFQCSFKNDFAQLAQVEPKVRCGFGDEAVVGHAGDRVDLQNPRLSGFVDHDVDPGDTYRPERSAGLDSNFGQAVS
jgi:hypothetical protein